jgi:D-alanyl-D-alanine carboxypeptidase (penicillin-binding protein 5/6)
MLKAVVIASANDATVAVAEHIAGTADAFVELMNQRAHELGLEHSVFHSVHGLPPGKGQEEDRMCAYDLAVVGRELMKYPEVLEWAGMKEAPFRDGQFQMTNTNHLILKTGYTRAAGFEVTATATRGDLNLIAVVMGAPTKKGCFDEAAKLLTSGFSQYQAVAAAKKGQAVGPPVPVDGGEAEQVNAIAAADLHLLVKRAAGKEVAVQAKVPRLLTAPVQKGQAIGEVTVTRGDETLGKVPLVVDRDVAATGWLSWWWNRGLASTEAAQQPGQ